jgi:hypothetical protein
MPDSEVSVSLTEHEKRQIRLEAARRDTSMSQLGRGILRDWLDDHADAVEHKAQDGEPPESVDA